MIAKLKSFLAAFLPETDADENPQALLSLASAALMVEVLISDYERKPEENDTLIDVLKNTFSLNQATAQALLTQAEKAQHDATDYFRFTSQINELCKPDEKVTLIENLWRVAYADGELHHYEEHVIRRIADLIHVSHRDFINAKLRVSET
ncbi:TerB family tellurite resistance protein [Amphritea sp. 1_MG-2023]|uniref:tellurite resistance TerB family protein n=1 Tax=Amphritea sp. 1_MG-2023 TaxID=3062670 RepID=UPI0026E2ABE6|nr:TerB family tellurite resistance protein [Amphritea sp. 1_MG-2023]MDO6563668.1 TerB family tellurite resistance protein [Amphritea sp. 1_MG-2023]